MYDILGHTLGFELGLDPIHTFWIKIRIHDSGISLLIFSILGNEPEKYLERLDGVNTRSIVGSCACFHSIKNFVCDFRQIKNLVSSHELIAKRDENSRGATLF